MLSVSGLYTLQVHNTALSPTPGDQQKCPLDIDKHSQKKDKNHPWLRTSALDCAIFEVQYLDQGLANYTLWANLATVCFHTAHELRMVFTFLKDCKEEEEGEEYVRDYR